MSMNQAKTWVQHPAYTLVQWTARNPFLFVGELAYIRDDISGLVTRAKVGPGYFNDLGYFDDIYGYADVPTNPIGDAAGSLLNLTNSEILHRMLNPYQPPVLSLARNNAGGSYATDWILEIGQSVAGPVIVTVSSTYQMNLLGATPLNVTAGGAFSNEGNFAFGPVSLSRAVPLNPSFTSIIPIALKVTHQKGTTASIITYLRHYPKIIWGVSQTPSILPAGWASLAVRQTAITNNFERDYPFNAGGYGMLAIPTMLAPAVNIYTDVTDPNAPAGYGMVDMGTQSINNGVATYTYQTYRTNFYINVPSILRVRKAA